MIAQWENQCISLPVLSVALVQFPAGEEYFKRFFPGRSHSANPSWPNVVKNHPSVAPHNLWASKRKAKVQPWTDNLGYQWKNETYSLSSEVTSLSVQVCRLTVHSPHVHCDWANNLHLFYSSECRRLDWSSHKPLCIVSRLSSLARKIFKCVTTDQELLHHCSRFARTATYVKVSDEDIYLTPLRNKIHT